MQVNFVNPGILGTYKQFFRQFESPIVKGRAPGCKAEAREESQMRGQEVSFIAVSQADGKLSDLSKSFVLRRTAEVLDNYLPPKREYRGTRVGG